MASANRHFIPGFVWHITQRCHKREFLLRFSKDRLKKAHHGWVEAEINGSDFVRKPHWTQSIAVGSQSFIEKIQSEFVVKTRGRKARELQHGFELREPQVFYNAVFGAKN